MCVCAPRRTIARYVYIWHPQARCVQGVPKLLRCLHTRRRCGPRCSVRYGCVFFWLCRRAAGRDAGCRGIQAYHFSSFALFGYVAFILRARTNKRNLADIDIEEKGKREKTRGDCMLIGSTKLATPSLCVLRCVHYDWNVVCVHC